nr:MAG TPA: hypothetical protein [Caudoviricetes sp.]
MRFFCASIPSRVNLTRLFSCPNFQTGAIYGTCHA